LACSIEPEVSSDPHLEIQLHKAVPSKRLKTLKITLCRLSRYLQVCPEELDSALHRLP
jgi:hypothetical protein